MVPAAKFIFELYTKNSRDTSRTSKTGFWDNEKLLLVGMLAHTLNLDIEA
jgi:hypothetical protein